jgi:hypothetical protein
MRTAEGAIACETVLERAPIVRKTMDIAKRTVKLNKKNMKNASGVRRKFVMK